jgi:hypothetical protein
MIYINNNTANKADRHTHTYTHKNIYIVSCYAGENMRKVDEDADNTVLDV